jgi:hypothetical protein
MVQGAFARWRGAKLWVLAGRRDQSARQSHLARAFVFLGRVWTTLVLIDRSGDRRCRLVDWLALLLGRQTATSIECYIS